MKLIGITGSIASGKSTISEYILSKGYTVIDADKISRESTQKGTQGYEAILKVFSKKILDEKGNINRKELSQVVFNNKKNLECLNGILHPIIFDCIDKKIEKSRNESIVFLDVPLLFETKLDQKCQEILVVYCDEEEQIQRIISRDNSSREKAKKIIAAQMDYKKKIDKATYAIENKESMEKLYAKVDIVLFMANGAK